jgi:glutamyl-Q tRNA(Asp) synthetase
MSYRGRFAPSPTGPLHFGSLISALASWLDARAHGGQWLLRMEDLDTPRCSPAFAQLIPQQLIAYGLEWDGPVTVQSYRLPLYQTALQSLERTSHTFPCACKRTERANQEFYPGTCRNGLPTGRAARCVRFRVPDAPVSFVDRRAGSLVEQLRISCGDFVLLRADGIFSYQLAVVVDDAEQGITHVVRGEDLLTSTARQIALFDALGQKAPQWLHVAVAMGPDGRKLSKQTCAPPVPIPADLNLLREALLFLGIVSTGDTPHQILQHAISVWPSVIVKP